MNAWRFKEHLKRGGGNRILAIGSWPTIKNQETDIGDRGFEEQLQEAKKVVDVIAAKVVELDTEVARLLHNSIAEISTVKEARLETAELRKVLIEESRVKSLERELEVLKRVKGKTEKGDGWCCKHAWEELGCIQGWLLEI